MMTRNDSIALIKVLLAAAWADTRLSQSEINYIKHLAKRFQLKDSDWLELEPYLEDAPSESEIDALFRDLLSRVSTPGGRAEIIFHMEEMLKSDDQMTAEEHDFLEQYSLIVREASTVELLVQRMKSLFAKKDPAARLDLEEFIQNKILFKLRRKLGTGQITPDMRRLCLLGGLMGVVAGADGEIDQRELEQIRTQLQARGRFEPEALDVLMTILEEESVRGLDRSLLITQYTADANFNDRVGVLDLLFAVAAANGSLTHAELEELRGISSAMHLSHKQYIEAKLRSKR